MPALLRALPVALILVAAGCASRPLPKYEKPIARSAHQVVRTTAYTHTESDHVKHGHSTAAGGYLRSGAVNSAAADWSRWPLGTAFRIQQTGEIFEVDDYGWALSGTNTIDLYKPSRRAMNAWGTHRVDIDILRWGDVRRSLAILRPRTKFRHVRRMVDQIESRYSELSAPGPVAYPAPMVASADTMPEPMPVAAAVPVEPPLARATAAAAPQRPGSARPLLTPFSADAAR